MDVHPVGIILKSNTLRGIRFEVSKKHWQGTSAYARLPDMVQGEFDAWHGAKSGDKVSIEWLSDGSNSVEHLVVLLRPSLGLKLLPYQSGASAPRPKGAASKRDYQTAITIGPYAWAYKPAAPDGVDKVEARRRAALQLLHCTAPHRTP